MNHANLTRNLLLIGNEQACEELGRILEDEYGIWTAKDINAAEDILERGDPVINLILIHADMQEDIRKAVEFVENSHNIVSIPILVYADSPYPADRFACLGNGVIDCITKPYISQIIKNRIENAILITDSMTFHGIEKILKQLPSNIYLKDNEARYIFATKYWHHLKKPDDANWSIRGKTDPEVRKDTENALDAYHKDLELIKTGKGTTYTIEINENGIQEFFQVIKQPLFNKNGYVTGIIGLINDVTEYELLKKKLREQVITDELTGLYNRTYLEEFIKMRKNDCYPLAIVSADCDGLKTINDTFGHTAGDEYIKAAVDLFKMDLPPERILFRMGGDEFLILLPATSEEKALSLVQQLRNDQKQFHIQDKELSISFGVSVMDSQTDNFHTRFTESDTNMYLEKKKKHKK